MLGLGTGLGVAIAQMNYLKKYDIIPTECGHISFPIRNEFDFEFSKFVN